MPPARVPKIWSAAIIGGGKVGTTLGRVLVEQGHRVVCVISRTATSARASAKFIGCDRAATDLAAIPADVNLILIATPHGAVADVARALGRLERSYQGVAVCHASGMLTAEVLVPVKARGATVFSFHPLQAFPRSFAFADIMPNVRGIYYGVDGPAAGMRAARALARALKGYVFPVPPKKRELYHAACVVASNHLTTLFGVLQEITHAVDPEAKDFLGFFFPIIMASMSNARSSSPGQALTGPVSRGGVETIARHLASLERHTPQAAPFYARVSIETTRLATATGSLSQAQKDELLRLLEPYLSPEAHHRKHP